MYMALLCLEEILIPEVIQEIFGASLFLFLIRGKLE
jgi:hypothetical protein